MATWPNCIGQSCRKSCENKCLGRKVSSAQVGEFSNLRAFHTTHGTQWKHCCHFHGAHIHAICMFVSSLECELRCQRVFFTVKKIHKKCCKRSSSLAQISTKSFGSTPPSPLAVSSGPTSKERREGGEKKEGRLSRWWPPKQNPTYALTE